MKPNTNNIVAATAAAAALAGGEAQANHTPTTPLTPATQEAVQLLADQASQTPLTPDSIITLPAPATPAAPEFIPEKKGGAEQIVPGGPGDSSDKLGTGPVDQDVQEDGFTKEEILKMPKEELRKLLSDAYDAEPGEVPATENEFSLQPLESPNNIPEAIDQMALGLGELAAKNTPAEEVEADADIKYPPVQTPVATQTPELPDKPDTKTVDKDPDEKPGSKNPEQVPGTGSEGLVPSDLHAPQSPEGPAGYPVNLVMGDAVQQMGDAVAQSAEAANTTPQETKAIRNPGE